MHFIYTCIYIYIYTHTHTHSVYEKQITSLSSTVRCSQRSSGVCSVATVGGNSEGKTFDRFEFSAKLPKSNSSTFEPLNNFCSDKQSERQIAKSVIIKACNSLIKFVSIFTFTLSHHWPIFFSRTLAAIQVTSAFSAVTSGKI